MIVWGTGACHVEISDLCGECPVFGSIVGIFFFFSEIAWIVPADVAYRGGEVFLYCFIHCRSYYEFDSTVFSSAPSHSFFPIPYNNFPLTCIVPPDWFPFCSQVMHDDSFHAGRGLCIPELSGAVCGVEPGG